MEETIKEKPQYKFLTKEEATKFFSAFYCGEHHIPQPMKEHGNGCYSVKHSRGDLATFDFNELTRLVVMAHECCFRVSINPAGTREVRIMLWKRQGRTGDMSIRHPDLTEAIEYVQERWLRKNEDYQSIVFKPDGI